MQIPTFTLLLAVAAVNGFSLPENMGDGIYIASAGSTEAKLVSRSDPSILEAITSQEQESTVSATEAREPDYPISAMNCYNGEHLLDGTNFEQAKAMLASECQDWNIPSGGSIVAVVGSVAVYACSWGGSNPCGEDEMIFMMARINDECGNLRSGDVWMQDWAKIYGRGKAWNSFCENASC